MNGVTDLTVAALAARIAAGELSARDAVQAHLDRIGQHDARLHAFHTVAAERALERAHALDAARTRGDALGPLHGVPVALKDNMSTRGIETTASSRILEGFVPPYNATVVERLEAAGAVIIGKTNLDEFAMGSSTENSAFGPSHNPWANDRTPGGSSGGSAVAVAARMSPGALGSDTGGSIRQPAALTGIVGLKPTYGRVSRYGLLAFASSLDQIGPFGRTAEDVALLLQVMAGEDPRDATAAREPVPDYQGALTGRLSGLRIGIPRDVLSDGVDDAVFGAFNAGIEVLRARGAEVVDVTLPHAKYGIPIYYLIATAEASSNLARYDGVRYGYRARAEKDGRSGDARSGGGRSEGGRSEGGRSEGGRSEGGWSEDRPLQVMYERTRDEGFGAEVKRRIMLGTYVLSHGYYDAYYLKAQQVRTLLRQDYDAAFQVADVIAMPTTPTPAFRLGEKTADPLQMYLADVFTVSANLAGVPAISIPCGFSGDRLPIGLQLTGRMFDEATLLSAADAYQRDTDHHLQTPSL